MSVTANAPLNPSDPFTATFLVRNESALPVHRLQIFGRIEKEWSADGGFMGKFSIVSHPEIEVMLPGETATATVPLTSMPFKPSAPIVGAHIAVWMKYRPSFVFWNRIESFAFTTGAGPNGSLIWYPAAQSEQNPSHP
jgi:hypothetical protein